ncbi:hypothetical protein [Actinoplanes utahensis]|uniref:hypothetical protein n=1 Tax=Actinoplanes utahensis TaxID=1869 RepID=UPI000AF86FFC|nr:hypothetical protein [Actinoplanes utahensis]GIF32368.1 hypothetical protein Aut01nite_53540 [Actinoplanes utahensis]
MTGFDTAAELRAGLGDAPGTREFLRRFARAAQTENDLAAVDAAIPDAQWST